MRVNPNSETPEVSGAATQPTRRPARLEQDQLTVTSSEKLSQALEATPAVRAEAVAQARALVRDTSYPPQELINKLAALLAVHLSTTEPAASPDPAQGRDASA